jgi:ABC-type Fe3+ transport system substrate-binding protein
MAKLVLKVGKKYAITGYLGKTKHDLVFKKGDSVEISTEMTIKEHTRKDDGAEKMIDYLLSKEKVIKNNDDIIKRKVFEKIEDEKTTIKKHSSIEKED